MIISHFEMTGEYVLLLNPVAMLLRVCARVLGFYDTLAYSSGFVCLCVSKWASRVCESVESDVCCEVG